MWVRPDKSEFRHIYNSIQDLEIKDIIAGLVAAMASYIPKQDPRFQLAEALVSGFAVPLLISLSRKLKKIEAQQTVFDIGTYIARKLEHTELPFLRYPDSKSLLDRQVSIEARHIFNYLESN